MVHMDICVSREHWLRFSMHDLSVVRLKPYSKWMRGITGYWEITLLSIHCTCVEQVLCAGQRKRVESQLFCHCWCLGRFRKYYLEALRVCALLNKANIVHITWLISQTGKKFFCSPVFFPLLDLSSCFSKWLYDVYLKWHRKWSDCTFYSRREVSSKKVTPVVKLKVVFVFMWIITPVPFRSLPLYII